MSPKIDKSTFGNSWKSNEILKIFNGPYFDSSFFELEEGVRSIQPPFQAR